MELGLGQMFAQAKLEALDRRCLGGGNGDNTGHFWYALVTLEGTTRRRQLAKHLYDEGLR